jgi:hypothetical protein
VARPEGMVHHFEECLMGIHDGIPVISQETQDHFTTGNQARG